MLVPSLSSVKALFFPMVAILAIASAFVVAQDAYGCTGFCPATKSAYLIPLQAPVNVTSPALQVLQPSTPLWNHLLVGKNPSVAVSGNGRYVAAGTENGKTGGHVYMYDTQGNLLWDYKTDSNITTVSISKDGSYVAASGYQMLDNGLTGYGFMQYYAHPALYFLSNNGTLLWKYESKAGQVIWHIAMPQDGSSVMTNIDGNIVSFDRRGNILWNYTAGNDTGSISVSSDGYYIVTNTADHVTYLDNAGKILWSSKIDSDANARSLVSQDGKYVLASSSDPGSGRGKLYLFDNKGNLLWTRPVDNFETMAISSGYYYIAESSSSTELLDLKGNVMWYGNSTTDNLAVSPDASYVLATGDISGQKNVIAYDTLGNIIWRFPVNDAGISKFSMLPGGSYLSFATSSPQSDSSTLYYFKVIQNFAVSPTTQPRVGSPPEQTRSGILPNDVTCNPGLELVIKSEGGSPACVSPKNVAVLIERGWARHESYYYDAHVEPKATLNDYVYKGIDSKDNVTVSINNQTYYQTTLDYSAYNLPRDTPIQFQNVTFNFPEGTAETPGGALVILDMKFQDGFEETYGTNTANGGSGIPVPTQYGIHQAVNSTTVLSNHMEPQAGMTIYHDRIKLLVSRDSPPHSKLPS